MSFEQSLRALAEKAQRIKDTLETEEATKTGLIMPFLAALGYDVFDPNQVIPEFVADVGTKKNEKIDYAIKLDGRVTILIECKKVGAPLDLNHASQLFRYFATVDARIAILTNGVDYKLFTDLDAPNRMDSKPFMEFSLLDLDPAHLKDIQLLSRQGFSEDALIATAGDLKYLRIIKSAISESLTNPSDEFVKLVCKQVIDGPFTAARREQFSPLVKKAAAQHMEEWLKRRLSSALNVKLDSPQVEPSEVAESVVDEAEVVTTAEELEAFFIVKGMIRKRVAADRIIMRDTLSYCGILLDDNNRKPLCRLYFNRKQRYVGTFDESRVETKIPINSLDDIYSAEEQIVRVLGFYLKE